MAHRTSLIPVLGLAALLASAAAIRAGQAPPAQPPLEKPSAKPAAQKPATSKPAAQKPSTAKPAADKAATKQPNAPFPAEPPKPGVPRDFKVPEPKRFTLDNGLEVALVQWGTMPKARVTLSMRTGNAFEKADEVWLARSHRRSAARGNGDPHRRADLRGGRAHGRFAHRQRRR